MSETKIPDLLRIGLLMKENGISREEITDQSSQRQLINLIESIIIYKFPQKSRKEIEAMFGLSDLKQTRVYQEALRLKRKL